MSAINVLLKVQRFTVHVRTTGCAATTLALCLLNAQKELIGLTLLLGGGACIFDAIVKAVVVFEVLLGVHDLLRVLLDIQWLSLNHV